VIKHLACIMDGNRRWAKERGLPPSLGHKEGVHAVERAAEFCLHHGIPYLTLYTFSLENFKRSVEEKEYIFSLLVNNFKEHGVRKFLEKNIKIRFVGDWAQFPASLVDICKEMEAKTAHCSALEINFLFCYGGQQEVTAAVKAIAQDVNQGVLKPEQITESLIYNYLWLGPVPNPELIIRTGGGQRLSNFLPYQSVYSELYFTPAFWPDITEVHLQEAVDYLVKCQRNLGA
jgi:undecaprenyl diphosphate synthase